LFGESLFGYRVYDILRAIDYLQSRDDIRKDKIATIGISAGGAVSLLAAAVDTRVKCAVVSCFLNDIDSSLLSHNHCACNFVPNLGKEFRLSDIGGLVAPRLLLLEATKDDQTFPLSGAKSAFEETKKIYCALKAPENVILFQTKGDHQFDGHEAFKRLKSAMQ
jgi:dienelactone hydrolase